MTHIVVGVVTPKCGLAGHWNPSVHSDVGHLKYSMALLCRDLGALLLLKRLTVQAPVYAKIIL